MYHLAHAVWNEVCYCACVNAESTRRLYEKKLEKAMEKAVVKPSPDKTYYREEGRMLPRQQVAEAVRHSADCLCLGL